MALKEISFRLLQKIWRAIGLLFLLRKEENKQRYLFLSQDHKKHTLSHKKN